LFHSCEGNLSVSSPEEASMMFSIISLGLVGEDSYNPKFV
jgi:hypothetical protein